MAVADHDARPGLDVFTVATQDELQALAHSHPGPARPSSAARSPLILNSNPAVRLSVGLTFAFQGKVRHEIERGQYPNDRAVLNNRHVFNAMVDHACGYVPDAPAR